jgi:hypothetical protein
MAAPIRPLRFKISVRLTRNLDQLDPCSVDQLAKATAFVLQFTTETVKLGDGGVYRSLRGSGSASLILAEIIGVAQPVDGAAFAKWDDVRHLLRFP